MKRLSLILLLFVYAAPAMPVELSGDDPARLIYMMEKGGLERRQAFWFAYQSKQFFLLRRVVRYLLDSDDYEDHRMILRIMEVLGPTLDTYIPGWYEILDRYMTFTVPDDLLIRCMKLSVRFKEHRMVFAITRMMEHPIHAVRLEAIQSLLAMENDNVVPVLIRYMKSDDPVLMIYGLQGARVLGDARLLPFIRELLEHRNKSVRIYALRAVAESKGEGDLSYLITGRFSRENNAEVRRTIVQIIGERTIGGQQYTVTRAMQDPAPIVREAAYFTAVQLRSSMFARELSLRLSQEEDSRLRAVIIDALTRLNMGDPLSALSRVAQSDADPALRSLAVRAIGKIRDRTQNDSLFQAATTDTDAAVRLEAAQSLTLLADPGLGPKLASAVENNNLDTEVRFLLFRALVKSGNREALRQLKERARNIQDPVLRNTVLSEA
jgi:HEAT repeat protein